MSKDNLVYETKYYEVHRIHRPDRYNGEYMNWMVVNKEHRTVETFVAALPNAMIIANNLDSWLDQLLADDTVPQQDLTLN